MSHEFVIFWLVVCVIGFMLAMEGVLMALLPKLFHSALNVLVQCNDAMLARFGGTILAMGLILLVISITL